MLGDVNIDLWAPNDPGQRPEIKALSEEYLSVLTQTAMCQQNFQPTRYHSHANPSLLDHIFASHPQKIDGVETKKNIIADHCTVRCLYHAKDLKIRQKQIRIRNHKLITSESLMRGIEENERLQRIFESEDPDYIAETIVAETNRIIEDIAPSKLIQCKKSHEPWATEDTEQIRKETESQLETAIATKDIEEWRLFRVLRNKAYKFIESVKRNYYIERFKNTRSIWKEFRKYKGEEDSSGPNKIVIDNKEVTSPKKLSNEFNKFFIKKITDIQRNFDKKDD